ncbi:MAG TPA: alpha/beta hydrolase [Actinomycetota bacterium]|nr:alpha/beta hydrolase [Actinomycetota bacterium]
MSGRAKAASAAIAAGAVAAGLAGRAAWKRRHPAAADGAWGPPPDDLGPISAFDGTGLAVRAAGDPRAPVLLFSHGFSLDMTTWREQWVELGDAFRCVALDHRAHGRSGIPETGDVTIRSMARDLASVLDAVAPEAPAILVGHSMGAIAILALAEQRPELFGPRVAGVALIGASASDLLRGAMGGVTELLRPRFGSLAAAARRVDRLRRAVLAAPRDVPAIVARVTQFAPDAPDELVDHVLHLAQRAPSIVWTDGLSELVSMDLRHALPRVTVPALVAVGDQDRVTPPASAVELAAALPDGHLFLVEGAGHLAMLERPERLNPELRSFAGAAFAGARRRPRKQEGAA